MRRITSVRVLSESCAVFPAEVRARVRRDSVELSQLNEFYLDTGSIPTYTRLIMDSTSVASE